MKKFFNKVWSYITGVPLQQQDTIERLNKIIDSTPIIELPKVIEKPVEKVRDYESCICIYVYKNNPKIDVYYDWDNENDKTAKRFAEMIHLIDSGKISQRIMNDLKNWATEDPKKKEFILNIGRNWAIKNQKESAAVEPIQFFMRGNR